MLCLCVFNTHFWEKCQQLCIDERINACLNPSCEAFGILGERNKEQFLLVELCCFILNVNVFQLCGLCEQVSSFLSSSASWSSMHYVLEIYCAIDDVQIEGDTALLGQLANNLNGESPKIYLLLEGNDTLELSDRLNDILFGISQIWYCAFPFICTWRKICFIYKLYLQFNISVIPILVFTRWCTQLDTQPTVFGGNELSFFKNVCICKKNSWVLLGFCFVFFLLYLFFMFFSL